jgi:hypothetical protein
MFEAQTQKARKERATSELEGLGFPFAVSFLGALQFESLVQGFSLDQVYSTKDWPIWPMDSSKRLVSWCPKPNSTIIVLGLAKNVIKLETVSSTGVQTTIAENPDGTERGFVVLIGESSYYIAKHSLIEAVGMHKVKIYKLADDMPLHVDIQIP